jgi:co-chaperonin GroES (HSP10)
MAPRPLNDWVVVEPRDSLEFDETGKIVLPDGYADDVHGGDGDFIRERNQLCLATVRAVGPGYPLSAKVRHPMHVLEGDSVLYNRADGRLNDDGSVLVRHHAIFAVVDGPVRPVFGGIESA